MVRSYSLVQRARFNPTTFKVVSFSLQFSEEAEGDGRISIHMLVAAAPQLAPAKLVQYIKGRSSRRLQEEFPHLRKRYWGQHLWA